MDCPICYELTNDFITTNCNHIFCINCITKIKRCAMCRTELTRSKLCKEIKQRYLQTNNYENINTNINENINVNINTNINENINENINTNINTNIYENINANINENINADPLYIPLDFWRQSNVGLAIPFAYLSYDEGHIYANLNTGETTIIPFTQEYIENLVGDA